MPNDVLEVPITPANPQPVSAVAEPVRPLSTVVSPIAIDLPSTPAKTRSELLQERVIEHEGQVGVFSPLTDAQGVPPDEEASRSVAKVIQSLEDEVGALKKANAELSRVAVRPPVRSQDFALALQNVVDQVQLQLGSTLNGVSDFGVKEFTLELKACLSVNASGEVEYTLVPLDSNVAAEKLSRIQMTIVPLPKKGVPDRLNNAQLDLSKPLSSLPGLKSSDLDALYRNRLYTLGDLLITGSRLRSTVEFAALLKVDRERLASWLVNAQLLALPGMNSATKKLLARCGIRNVASIAQQEATQLLAKLNKEAAKTKLTSQPLSVEDSKRWIEAAANIVADSECK